MKTLRYVALIALITMSMALPYESPVRAACPDMPGNATRTNPSNGDDCAGTAWDGGDGNDTLINGDTNTNTPGDAASITGGPGNINENNTIDNTTEGTVEGNIYGNYNFSNSTTDSTGNVTNSGLVKGFLIGNRAGTNIDGSTANITLNAGNGGTTGVVDNDVYGNWAETGSVESDSVAKVTNNGLVKGYLFGNHAADAVDSSSATIILGAGNGTTTGAVNGEVLGNYSAAGVTSSMASVTNSGYVGSYLYGNFAGTGVDGSSAIVTLNAGNGTTTGVVNGYVYGNYAAADSVSGGSRANVTNAGLVNGYVYGNYADADVDNSSATVSNSGTINNSMYGNYTYDDAITDSTAIVSTSGLVKGFLFGNSTGNDLTDSSADVTVGTSGEVDADVYGNNAYGTIVNGSANVTINGLVKGDVYGNNAVGGTPNGNSKITVSGTGNVKGSIVAAGDASSVASVQINGPVGHQVSTGGGADTIVIRSTIGASLPAGSDAVLAGAGNDSIAIASSVHGNIKSGQGSDAVTVFSGADVSGIISGNDSLTPDDFTVGGGTNPGDVDVLTFNFTTASEGDLQSLKNELGDAGSGTLTFEGHTYTWVNFTQLQVLLEYILTVTWFNPGDGRVDPRPADRLAFYCNIDQGTVGAYLVNGDSTGTSLTTFTIPDLRTAGTQGIYHNLGSLGVVSLSVDGQNNFWGAWNGGIWHANGQGNFAKSFHCDFK